MVSNNFWKDKEADPQFEDEVLHRLLENKPKEQPGLRLLLKQYYRSIVLNVIFLTITLLLYFVKPVVDLLLPVSIIASCFIYILNHITTASKKINQTLDMSLDLKTTLTRTIDINNKINNWFCRINSWVLTTSFVGGFLLGLLMSDWTIAKMLDRPLIILILVVLATGFYFLTKTRYFSSMHHTLNPSYFKAKQQLEAQLRILNET